MIGEGHDTITFHLELGLKGVVGVVPWRVVVIWQLDYQSGLGEHRNL